MNASRVLAFLLIAMVSAVVADALGRYGGLGLNGVEVQTEGWRQQTTAQDRGPESENPSEVVLVFFDEDATAEWPYYSPYPRAILAELIESLTAAGARGIGLDVYLGDLSRDLQSNGDDRLAAAIEAAGNVVLVAPTIVTDSGPVLAEPHPKFADPAWAVASADLPNAFETVTDAALVTRSGNELRAGFALALYAQHRGLDLDSLLLESRASGQVSLTGLDPSLGQIPESWWEDGAANDDAVLPLSIRFIGPPSDVGMSGRGNILTFPAYSSAYLSTLAIFTPEFFADKTVLLGSGWHDSDKFRTAFSNYRETTVSEEGAVVAPDAYQWMYGVEVHANVLQNYLDGELLRRASTTVKWIWLILLALFVSVGVFQSGPIVGSSAFLIAILSAVAGSFWAWTGELGVGRGLTLFELDQAYLMLPLVTLTLAPTIAYGLSSAWVALVEGKEKRFIQGAFGKYVSPDVVSQITKNPDALQLGGQKKMLTILFSDLSGFTTLSERLGPQELIAHLNEYLTEMTDIVMDEAGTLDKYIGDAIMAFWNAPAPVEDHADRALRCAVMMQRQMIALNTRWLADDPDAETLVVRIGINSGEVVVGNVGGKNRFDYSAIGDAVNLSARLEPANKSYDTLTMCSEFTLAMTTPGAFRVRELDYIAVKGKLRPVKVYEVLELAGVSLGPEREAALTLFEQGMKRYKNHDWEAAAEDFRAALESHPDDGPSKVYLERSAANVADPPPADWDFVVRRSVK